MQTIPLSFDQHTITVRELSVRQIRDWYQSLVAGELFGDWVQETALEDIGLIDLAYMTDAAPGDLEDLTHAQLLELATAARSINPGIFRLRAQIRACAKEIGNLLEVNA
ncbi:hypothetical protein [Thauera mechernichensis]